MARRHLIRTTDLPYHLYGRSNNKEWFYLPLDQVWRIFSRHLSKAVDEMGLRVHAFVLMSNHYHLVASVTSHSVDQVMCRLLKGISDEINLRADRTNHVFGGPYKWTLIENGFQYHHVIRYGYQNPVRANLCQSPREYQFSSLRGLFGGSRPSIPLVCHPFDEASLGGLDWFSWLDEVYDAEHVECLRRALSRRKFAFGVARKPRRIAPQFALDDGKSEAAPLAEVVGVKLKLGGVGLGRRQQGSGFVDDEVGDVGALRFLGAPLHVQ